MLTNKTDTELEELFVVSLAKQMENLGIGYLMINRDGNKLTYALDTVPSHALDAVAAMSPASAMNEILDPVDSLRAMNLKLQIELTLALERAKPQN